MNDIREGKRFRAWECKILIYALELKTVLFGSLENLCKIFGKMLIVLIYFF